MAPRPAHRITKSSPTSGPHRINTPAFIQQQKDAGIYGLPFSWTDVGDLWFPPGLTTQQIAQIQAVYDAHDPVKGDLADHANKTQTALEIGGFTATIEGTAWTFVTDVAGQAAIFSKALRLMQPNPPTSVVWQFGTNTVDTVTITATDFSTCAVLINDFVQQTFMTLDTVFADIASGTITNNTQIEARFAAISNSAVVS